MPELGEAITAYRDDYAAREAQTRAAVAALRDMLPTKSPLAALPTISPSSFARSLCSL